MRELILIGGGGHCKSCIDVIESTGTNKIVGIVDNNENLESIGDYAYLGRDEQLSELLVEGRFGLVTVGQIKRSATRQKIFEILKDCGAVPSAIVSPLAYRSSTSTIGDGTIVMHAVVVNSYAEIGENCIINSQALIEHDVVVQSHSHISTGARINGGVSIGENCFIGSGAVVHHGKAIGDNCVVSAGAIVSEDLPSNSILRIVK